MEADNFNKSSNNMQLMIKALQRITEVILFIISTY